MRAVKVKYTGTVITQRQDCANGPWRVCERIRLLDLLYPSQIAIMHMLARVQGSKQPCPANMFISSSPTAQNGALYVVLPCYETLSLPLIV